MAHFEVIRSIDVFICANLLVKLSIQSANSKEFYSQ